MHRDPSKIAITLTDSTELTADVTDSSVNSDLEIIC